MRHYTVAYRIRKMSYNFFKLKFVSHVSLVISYEDYHNFKLLNVETITLLSNYLLILKCERF